MSNDTVRDERLGAALHALDVPEHRPEFHRELRRRLAEERRPRRRWVPVAAVAAVAAIAVVAIGIPRTHTTPAVASAAVAGA